MSRYVAGHGLTVGQLAVIDTLRGHMQRYCKEFCWPAQETILYRLRKFHNIKICKRTLNYWLRDMEKKLAIYRVRRLSREKFKSTIYYILNYGGHAVVKAKKIIGMAKRLSSSFPSRVQRTANNMHTTHMQNSGGTLKREVHASKRQKLKRCEAPELEKAFSVSMPERRPGESEETLERRRIREWFEEQKKNSLLGKAVKRFLV